MHKFIHTFAQYNIQMPNTNAVTVPIAVAISEPLPRLCPWPISMHKFIHTLAKYNLQMPNTNAMPISIAVAVPISVAKPLPRQFPWLMPMPMPVSNACVQCYFIGH